MELYICKGLMTPSSNTYFLDTIGHLRRHEEMLIYDRFTTITTKAEQAVGEFLQQEYERECLGFPGIAPNFEQGAAIWAARTVFIASQLLLSREKDAQDMVALLPDYKGAMTPGAILSADLCLRCLPDVIGKAKEISPDDPLIQLLEAILWKWHYSGIGHLSWPGEDRTPIEGRTFIGDKTHIDNWESIAGNECLLQLYVDRAIDRQAIALAKEPILRSAIMAAMGDHSAYFWKEV